MNEERSKRVCPVEIAGGLDNFFRRLLQNPRKILSSYIVDGMTVLDLGCGPGFFSVEIAKMLSGSGKVIAADLQEGMLEKVSKKIKGTELERRITLHKCEDSKIGLTENVDFVLAFYMVHEVPSQDELFAELKSVLKPGGKLYIIEPKVHVSRESFDNMIDKLKTIGFEFIGRPKVLFSRTVLVTKTKL
ncbi:MAG: class I SAM-dependent methyltransferase [Candidatus Kryptoniota bacterium]